jgi:hypothetical protein
MKTLTESNFLLYAAANYNNQCYDTEEFYDDLKRFKYLKRLFSRYKYRQELKERLILNHLITLYNVFNYEAATRMLFFRISEDNWPILKTFLIYMMRMPENVEQIGTRSSIESSDIGVDLNVANILREL